jgi:hypothetical protein
VGVSGVVVVVGGRGGKNEEKMAGGGFYFGLMDFAVVVEHGFRRWV